MTSAGLPPMPLHYTGPPPPERQGATTVVPTAAKSAAFYAAHPCGCGAVIEEAEPHELEAELGWREPRPDEPRIWYRFPTGYVRLRHPGHEDGPWALNCD